VCGWVGFYPKNDLCTSRDHAHYRDYEYSCTAIWVRNHSKDGLNSTGDVGYHSELPYAVAGVNEAYGASILGIYFGNFGLDILYN